MTLPLKHPLPESSPLKGQDDPIVNRIVSALEDMGNFLQWWNDQSETLRNYILTLSFNHAGQLTLTIGRSRLDNLLPSDELVLGFCQSTGTTWRARRVYTQETIVLWTELPHCSLCICTQWVGNNDVPVVPFITVPASTWLISSKEVEQHE